MSSSDTKDTGREALNVPAVVSPERALVVDDDPQIRDVIYSALSGVGYEVDTVSSATEALKIFSRKPSDLVITDWQMPGMNGIDLVNKLKQQDPHLAAILVTGFGTKQTVIDAFTRGKINYFLPKPFKLAEFLETVSAALRERKLKLSERDFRQRLESEIQSATKELEQKNILLQRNSDESESLYRELQKRQEEIEGTKEYLEQLIESSLDAIISLDQNNLISFFSRGAEDMFGFDSEKILSGSLDRLFVGGRTDVERFLNLLAAEKRLKNFEAEMFGRGRKRIFTDISAATLYRKDGEQGLLLIIKDITERKRLENELLASNLNLEKLSLTDGLTDLFNHRHFQQCLTEEFQRARRFNTQLSLIMIDLDDFKLVNDTYGHQVGDQVLILIAELIRESIREVDTPARYGGEEFAVILPQTDVANAIVVAERIKNAVEWSPRFRDIESGLTMTASLGVSVFPDKGIKSTKRLIRFADKALYRAKEIGKNRIVIGSSAGERPLGRGERLTQAEKRGILSRVADTLRGTLNLDEILDYLLREISAALRHNGWEPPCSIMLMDKNQGLQLAAERSPDPQYQTDFKAAAQLILKKRKLRVFREKDGCNPATSYPILIDSPIKGREVVGVINIGTIPTDLGFFQDFANQAALGITNAKLFREAQDAKISLEKKVNELTTLSMMGMTMQRNALEFEDFQQENFKLLARCLTQTGFERALVYGYDPDKKLLKNGMDDSLRGDKTPFSVSLAGLRRASFFISAVSKKEAGHGKSPISFSTSDKMGAGDRKILKILGIDRGDIALLGLNEDGEIKYLVIAVKALLQKEDLEALSQFILHAGLVMENLNLSRMFQDKAERLTLLHETCVNLSTAETSNDWNLAAHEALTKLTGVLDAAEISVYSFTGQDQTLKLVAYASASALPGLEPAQRVRLKDSKIMGALVNNVLKKGLSAPLVVEDIGSLLGRWSKKRFATSSYLGIPLFGGGGFLGVMNITDKLDQTPFTPDDVELAQVTGGLLAAVLQNIFLISRMEARAAEVILGLVNLVESTKKIKDRGRTERVAGLSSVLAEAMGLEEEGIIFVRKAALLDSLTGLESNKDAGQGGYTAGSAALFLIKWLQALNPAVYSLETSESVRGPAGSLVKSIVSAAQAFDSLYLQYTPKQRPPLEDVLFNILAETRAGFDSNVVDALFRSVIKGNIRRGSRRVKPEAGAFEALSRRLAKTSGPQGGAVLPKEIRKQFLKLIKDELQAGNG